MWLLSLIVIPSLVMVALAGSIAARHRAAAKNATAVSDAVLGLSRLVALEEALQSEHALQSFDARFEASGVTSTEASSYIGVDVDSLVAPARERVLRAIARLAGDSPVSARDIERLHGAIDAGALDSASAASELGRLADGVFGEVIRRVDALKSNRAPDTTEKALETLQATLVMQNAATDQGLTISYVVFPPTAATTRTMSASLVDLGRATSQYRTAMERVRAAGVTAVVTGLRAMAHDPALQTFADTVDAALRGDSVAQPADADARFAAALSSGFFAREAQLAELVASASNAARAAALDSEGESRRQFWEAIAVAATLIVLTVTLVGVIGRRLSSRIGSLADYVRRLNGGELDATPPSGADVGPREIELAIDVVTELAVTLRLIEAKTTALANASFDDPVLAAPLTGRLGQALERSVTRLAVSIEDRDHAWQQSMDRLARAVDLRDDVTGAHTHRVGEYCDIIARSFGLASADRELLVAAAPMHDLGKIGVPDDILLKPGRLTPAERRIIERHCDDGHRLLAGSGSPLLDMAAKIAYTHHERYDGGGYPRGLAGTNIPIEGRIVAVADVFDALTSCRPYRPARTVADAVAIVRSERGTHFDPAVVDAFLRAIDEIVALRKRYDGQEGRGDTLPVPALVRGRSLVPVVTGPRRVGTGAWPPAGRCPSGVRAPTS